jgi:hypothetical protein
MNPQTLQVLAVVMFVSLGWAWAGYVRSQKRKDAERAARSRGRVREHGVAAPYGPDAPNGYDED